MSRDDLRATDHASGAGAIRGFVPCELDREEGFEAVREPMINRSVVTIRLLMRAPYCGATAINVYAKRSFEEKKVITRNELCWYIPGFPAKQGTAQLFALCICPGSCTVLVLRVSTIGPRYLGESQVRFSERDNNRD